MLIAHKHETALRRQVHDDISASGGSCEHLQAAVRPGALPVAPPCKACEEHSVDWVQVRWCLTCGHIGCCDDGVAKHAREHFEQTGHEVIATAEAGGTWAYCYTHDISDPDWLTRNDS